MDIYSAVDEHLGHPGRILSGSKQGPPSVYWNACVFIKGRQVWYGDLDTEADTHKVQAAANMAGETLYVTPEQPYRWDGLDFKKGQPVAKDHRPVLTFTPEAS